MKNGDESARAEVLRAKFVQLSKALQARFFERSRVIDGTIIALLARQHVLLLGSPGTAKSAITNTLCGVFGGHYFSVLMTRFTQPEELFGPPALSAMKEDRFERKIDGYLPTAHVAFLDETFKANSAILNSLLTLQNERRYRNGTQTLTCPLQLLVGASNELPEGGATGELGAYFDRFLLRYWVEPMKDDANFVSLLADDDQAQALPEIPAITLAELEEAQALVAAVKLPRPVAMKCAELRKELAALGVAASDRRWLQATAALRANAWLGGDDAEVTEDAFTVLADCLWDTPDQRKPVATAVQLKCASQAAEALKIHDSLVDMINKLPDDSGERAKNMVKVTREAKRAETELDRLLGEATSESSKRTIARLRGEITTLVTPLRQEAMRTLGLEPTP